jgi:hypothetical protein
MALRDRHLRLWPVTIECVRREAQKKCGKSIENLIGKIEKQFGNAK